MSAQAYLPPSNIEAEQALLGAILYENALFADVCEGLRARHFYDPVHGRIFSVIATLIENKRLANPVTLREHFARDGAIEEIGGAAYLLTLLENAARIPAHAAQYARLVIEAAMRRAALVDIESARASILTDMATPAEDILTGLEKRLGDLASGLGAREEDVTLREAGKEALDDYFRGGAGLSTGLGTLDDMIAGLFAEDLLIIAGRPSMGKSSLADNIASNVAARGGSVAFWSGEMAPKQIAERALSRASHGGEEAFQYRAFRRRDLPERNAARLQAILPNTLVVNGRGAITLEGLRAFLRRVRRRNKRLDLLVVDYLQLMHDDQGKFGAVARVSAITAGLKAIAKDFKIPVIALSQLSRELERRDDKRPKLSDLRESGSIEQDADFVLFVYREQYYLEREEPRPSAQEARHDFDVRHARWSDQMMAASGKVEIIAGKARHDAVGAKWLDVDLGFDLVADPQQPINQRRPRT